MCYIVTDETEVVLSSHDIDPSDTMSNDDERSPNYVDTEVTEEDRTVKFWNTANFSDATTGKTRRARAGIIIDGGSPIFTSWHNYTSPLTSKVFQPDDTVTVPHNGPSHEYDIETKIEVDEQAGVTWSSLKRHTTTAYIATVNET